MLDLRALFGRGGSREQAKERLRLVLIHDRTSLAPETMAELKERLLEVIGEFLVVDKEKLEMGLEKSEDEAALIASIPIKGVRRQGTPLTDGN